MRLINRIWLAVFIGFFGGIAAAEAKDLHFLSCHDFVVTGKFKTEEERFKALLDRHWRYTMQESPEFATAVGYPGQNSRWSDSSLPAIERRKKNLTCQISALQMINYGRLSSFQRTNYDLLMADYLREQQAGDFGGEYLEINHLASIVSHLVDNLAAMPRQSLTDYQNILSRLETAPAKIDQSLELLKAGLKRGITPPQAIMTSVPRQFSKVLNEDISKSPLFEPFSEIKLGSKAEQKLMQDKARQLLAEQVYPRLRAYKNFLLEEYIPKCRTTISWQDLPKGNEWYAFAVKLSTTTDMTPEAIHQLGLREVERIASEMTLIRQGLKFNGGAPEFNNFLLTDKQFYFESAAELLGAYRAFAKQVDGELPKLFKTLPRLSYGVREIPEFKALSSPTAYYTSGSLEAGRAGYFEANTSNIKTRPKWAIAALTLHEAVPGHHLQIALAQEQGALPEFRKHGGYTAFSEGWGLYAETLGEELGFYKDPYVKYGELIFEMWRACRLVVDTGIHQKGWSRDQAIAYMLKNLAKSKAEVEVEVDRYIVWPGQALAYKIGQLKFLELRKLAEAQLKDKFDLREFHEVVLGQGSLPMEMLEKSVTTWIGQKLKK